MCVLCEAQAVLIISEVESRAGKYFIELSRALHEYLDRDARIALSK
jgi:hypothetical protein